MQDARFSLGSLNFHKFAQSFEARLHKRTSRGGDVTLAPVEKTLGEDTDMLAAAAVLRCLAAQITGCRHWDCERARSGGWEGREEERA